MKRPARPEPVSNWSTLAPGTNVQIRQNGQILAAGHIDMMSIDGSLLWLRQAADNQRTLFLKSDPVKLYRYQPDNPA